MNVDQFRIHIVRDTLKSAGWWSQAIENLIVGTAMVETGLEKLVQDGCGVARGLFEIEPVTYASVLEYIKRDATKVKTILTVCNMVSLPEDVNAVIWNLRYAVLITRMFYYRFPESLPPADNAEALYQMYKNRYNSGKGAATELRDLPIFKQVCQYQDRS